MRQLIDADVLIGALDRSDAHHAEARRLLSAWRRREDQIAVSLINFAEVLVAPSADAARLATAREAIAALGITVFVPNEAIGVEAARLRQRHPVSLPDAFCLASAKHLPATLTSFDQKVIRAAQMEGIKTI
jgi:predicted nucleic acid-binding protein